MARCEVCGKHENMPYNCDHCGNTHCSEHRLPENHDCPALHEWNDPQGVFDSGFDDGLSADSDPARRSTSRSESVLERFGVDTGPGGPLGYFRNNLSFLFLGIIVLVFGLQYIVSPLVGIQPGSQTWRNIFTINSANPHYVWTWVISVFSHGSPIHLLFNAIVLYFFGPIVEKQIGSKAFGALFLGSGMIAGLAEIGAGFAIGAPVVGVLGASGAILALMGVLAITAPDLKVLLFFVLPVSVRTLAIGYAALSVLGFVSQGTVMGNVAHMAHLVGLVIGLWYGNRIKDRVGRGPQQLNIGPGRRGPGGPGGRI
ncbi:MAG: rhomboid family intramembrane serine protease [Natronomonas sp.]